MKSGLVFILSILMIIILGLLLVSCSPPQIDRNPRNYKSGIAELEVDPARSLFPNEVYTEFGILFTLHNKAGYDAENVQVNLAGFDETFVNIFSEQESVETIAGRSIFDEKGGSAEFIYRGEVKDLSGAEFLNQPYFIDVNYDSKFEFSPSLCVGPAKILENIEGSGCKVDAGAIIRFNGQGAPLAVESLQVVPLFDDEIEFRMKIKNKKSGDVQKLTLGQAKMVNQDLTCEFRGETEEDGKSVRMGKNKPEAELVCRGKIKLKTNYETSLFLEFGYNYHFVKRKSLTLKR